MRSFLNFVVYWIMPKSPILHVFVVGFHHKKGCQVEYCFPPLDDGGKTEICDADLPDVWHLLPSLALPDGAHNVEKDTVFFLLPCRDEPNKTIYGVSCYRQMAANKLLSKSPEVTRSSVQKSVCVLSRLPLFGVFKSKLELITQAYFNERDFAKVEVLAEMYDNLCSNVTIDMVQTYSLVGVSACELIRKFRSRSLVLFKLLLLEKRVLFFMFPVHRLCHTILTLISLFPYMIEEGLCQASIYLPNNHSIINDSSDDSPNCSTEVIPSQTDLSVPTEEITADQTNSTEPGKTEHEDLDSKLLNELDKVLCEDSVKDEPMTPSANDQRNTFTKITQGLFGQWTQSPTTPKPVEIASDASETVIQLKSYSTLKTNSEGFPLSIFTKGSLCHPYLPLGYLDTLQSDSVRAYLFGATNALFKQRKDLVDVIVTISENGEPNIEFLDPELETQLTLSSADLRFADFLIKSVAQETGNVFLDSTSWEGGEDWLRLQFRAYLLSLMASVKHHEAQYFINDFNPAFVQAWKTKHNYRIWACGHYPALKNAAAGHPFAGQIGVSDIKLRLSHTMDGTASGRKIAQAVSSTSDKIAETGRNVRSKVFALFTEVGQIAYTDKTPTTEHKEPMSTETNNDNQQTTVVE